MTEQERINADVQMKLAMQDAKFNAFVEEMRDFKTEMRQQNQMRAEEARELRQKQEADMKEIRASLDGMGKHVRNLTIAAMVGMGSMTIAGIAVAISIFLK